MTGFQLPDTLRQHRPLLLALEAIGWLHMTGKAKIDFLQEHGGQKDNYEYKRWHEQETPPFPWNDLLKWVKGKYSKSSANNVEWPDTLTAFIREHAEGKSKPNLVGLLQAGHAIASGIEKQSYPESTVRYLAQDANHMWLSTAFGRTVRNLLDNNGPELLTKAGWKRLLGQIEGLLTELKRLGHNGSPNDIEGWWQWREGAIGSDGWLRKAFTSTLAETRLPNNDVTLFDQSYVAAALFKSAAAGAILEGSRFLWNVNLKQDTRWRILTVGIGADHYEARAVKIGDGTGTRLAAEEFFTKARQLVEVELAVGSLLYRDGSVCVFSFPGERIDHQGRQGGDFHIDDWKNWLTGRLDGYARATNFEMPPYCDISDEPYRSLVRMTAEIRKAQVMMATPHHRNWDIPVPGIAGGHVCPVCLVRRNGSKTDKQKVCEPCRGRREKRRDQWLKNRSESDTIWISELADTNDRLALLTMSLDIEPWLDGSRLDSLRTQAIAEWRKCNPELSEFWKRDEDKRKKEPNPIDPNRPFDSLRHEIMKRLGQFKEDDLLLCNLQEGYRHAREKNDQRSDDEIWKSYFSLIVEDRVPNERPDWDPKNLAFNAKWITHQLFRKLASPGRIYRFQRQAEDFFKTLLAEFREMAAADLNRWRTRRLLLSPDPNTGSWKDNEPYSGHIGGVPIDLLWRKDLGGFITIANIGRMLDSSEDKESIVGKTIPLKDDDNNPADKLIITAVDELSGDLEHLGVYRPAIPLEISPVRFRVLVPLEVASACVDRTLEAWNNEFARVSARLPIRIGVVAFLRKTPFQAVIEATRNLEEDLRPSDSGPETWRIVDTEIRDGTVAMSVAPVSSSSEPEQWSVPTRLPDGREDVFYPYMEVEDSEVCFPLDFRHPKTDRVYRHAKDVKRDDGIRVHPSRVAVMFMDDTGKRFEPSECKPLKQWKRMRELWKLLDRTVPGQTALRSAWSEALEKHDSWKGPHGVWLPGGEEAWLDIVRAAFNIRLDLHGDELETVVGTARDEVLGWCLDWHLRVLKQKVTGGKA